MATETRTCGQCCDCKHWGGGNQSLQPDLHGKKPCPKLNTPQFPGGIWIRPDFGCVLFEARPQPRVVKARILGGEVCKPQLLESVRACFAAAPGNVTKLEDETHLYHVPYCTEVYLLTVEEQ